MAEQMIKITVDTSEAEAKLAIILKHLTALADELRQLRQPEPPAEPIPRRDPASTIAARSDLAPRRTTHPTGFGPGGTS